MKTISKSNRIRNALVMHHTRREIADSTGINPREVQYILHTLEDEGIVRCDRGKWPHEWNLAECSKGAKA